MKSLDLPMPLFATKQSRLQPSGILGIHLGFQTAKPKAAIARAWAYGADCRAPVRRDCLPKRHVVKGALDPSWKRLLQAGPPESAQSRAHQDRIQKAREEHHPSSLRSVVREG